MDTFEASCHKLGLPAAPRDIRSDQRQSYVARTFDEALAMPLHFHTRIVNGPADRRIRERDG